MSSESRSQKPWFQDGRTGCEKQTHYFVRIRKLQDELINREQHNLINAMERLRQISNPRRKTAELGEDGIDSLRMSSQLFPSRQLNLRKQAKHKAIPKNEKPDLKPVSGKPLIPEREEKNCGTSVHPFFAFPLLTDTDIAKIVHNASCSFPREPSVYLLQPHLPSIPNAGRKANFVLDNRMRLLTLAGSDPEFSEENVTGTTKKIHKGNPKKSGDQAASGRGTKSSETNRRGRKQQVLRFDVDPNDRSIFTHTVGEDMGKEMITPLPPPNSRPSSTKVKCHGGNAVNPDDEFSLAQESKEINLAQGSKEQSSDGTAVITSEESLEKVDQLITNTEQSAEIREQTVGEIVDEPVTRCIEERPEQLAQETEEQAVTAEDQSEEAVEHSRDKAEDLIEREELVEPGMDEVPGDTKVTKPEQVKE